MQNNYAKYTVEFAPAYFRKYALDIPARRLKDDTITDILRKNIDKDIRVNKIIKKSLKQFCVLINIPRHIAVKTGRFTSNHPYTVVSVCRNGLNPLARERMICYQTAGNLIEKTVLDFYIDEREVFRVWEMNGYPRKLILDGDYRKQQMLPVIIISRSTSRVKWIPWKR